MWWRMQELSSVPGNFDDSWSRGKQMTELANPLVDPMFKPQRLQSDHRTDWNSLVKKKRGGGSAAKNS